MFKKYLCQEAEKTNPNRKYFGEKTIVRKIEHIKFEMFVCEQRQCKLYSNHEYMCE